MNQGKVATNLFSKPKPEPKPYQSLMNQGKVATLSYKSDEHKAEIVSIPYESGKSGHMEKLIAMVPKKKGINPL